MCSVTVFMLFYLPLLTWTVIWLWDWMSPLGLLCRHIRGNLWVFSTLTTTWAASLVMCRSVTGMCMQNAVTTAPWFKCHTLILQSFEPAKIVFIHTGITANLVLTNSNKNTLGAPWCTLRAPQVINCKAPHYMWGFQELNKFCVSLSRCVESLGI